MGTDKISLSSTAMQDYFEAQKKKNASNPIEVAKGHSDQIKEEVEEHERLSQNDDYLSTIRRRINSGFYNKSQLESIFSNLTAGTCNTDSHANKILYSSQISSINDMKEEALNQAKKLENFDPDVRFEDIVTNRNDKEGIATKEDWDLAQAVLQELQASGDESISFSEVLSEVQSGHYNS